MSSFGHWMLGLFREMPQVSVSTTTREDAARDSCGTIPVCQNAQPFEPHVRIIRTTLAHSSHEALILYYCMVTPPTIHYDYQYLIAHVQCIRADIAKLPVAPQIYDALQTALPFPGTHKCGKVISRGKTRSGYDKAQAQLGGSWLGRGGLRFHPNSGTASALQCYAELNSTLHRRSASSFSRPSLSALRA